MLTSLAQGKGTWSQVTVDRASHSLRKPHLLTRTGLLNDGQASSCGPSSTVDYKPAKNNCSLAWFTASSVSHRFRSHLMSRQDPAASGRNVGCRIGATANTAVTGGTPHPWLPALST